MLEIGCVPDNFGLGITTPIPKFKGNKKSVSANDFKGITVSPVISKIFEYCMLENKSSITTSDRQYSFKKGVNCNNSLHTVRKVINFFNLGNSTINVAVIDVKKVFDKVNHYGLLNMLVSKNINVKLINVLENWFQRVILVHGVHK